jgi:hypothetical protein
VLAKFGLCCARVIVGRAASAEVQNDVRMLFERKRSSEDVLVDGAHRRNASLYREYHEVLR